MTFTKGQSGNPKGRRTRPAEERYLKAVIKSMSPDDWNKVLDRVKLLAMRGERWAVEFYADRIIGKPLQRNEVTGADGNELVIRYVNDWRDNSSDPS